MEELFTQPPLVDCLPSLESHSSRQQLTHWQSQKGQRQRATSLISQLGNPSITVLQAKRLDQLGIDFHSLCQLRGEATNKEEFMEVMRSKGARSKQLREKLALLVPCHSKL